MPTTCALRQVGQNLAGRRPEPAWTLWYQILEGYGGLEGLQQRKPMPSGRPGGRGVMVRAVSRQGCGGLGRGDGAVRLSVRLSSQAAEDPTRLAWPQPRRPCRRPPRLSSRRCLSGQVGGSPQTAGPHACGQGAGGSVSGAQLRRAGGPAHRFRCCRGHHSARGSEAVLRRRPSEPSPAGTCQRSLPQRAAERGQVALPSATGA